MPKFHVSRSIEIAAPPEKVFEVVSDFNTWPNWSPWLIAEPDAKVTISADSNSVGSTYAWDGQVTGAGGMEHKKLDAPTRIESEIRFLRPMKSVSLVSFDLQPSEGGTTISWNMDGSLPFFLFFMVKMMDTWLGMDYERGLRMLKEWIETGNVTSQVNVHGKEQVAAIRMAGVQRTCSLAEIGPTMQKAICEMHEKFTAAGAPLDGAFMSVYPKFDMKTKQAEFIVGLQIPDSVAVPAGLVEWTAPDMAAFRVEHIGPYDHLGNGWSTGQMHLRYKKIKQCKVAPFEIYRNSPEETAPVDLVTDIYLPLK